MFIWGMLLLFTLPNIQAQEPVFRRDHHISLTSELTRSTPATGTLNVVAVMVEFQPDSNRLTSGTGVFGADGFDGLSYLSNQEITYIDPLPHNQGYFEAHLEFAKNYFLKSSDSQLTLDYRVFPNIIRLDSMMATYSPTGETFTMEKIATLMHDVWTKADEDDSFAPFLQGLDPDNTAFVIFHAGVGRDVELTGTSLDITPLDLPSIFLNQNNISELLDLPGFNGFEINNGAFRVTNSMLIPRTESRRGEDVAENEIVFPLSINGLLCASIGSYLGLPDLFNTETGEPAIGRFGLMDGAGFFAYQGLLPPEPSAWEKVYLGWETPFSVSPTQTEAIQLPAASLAQPNSIAKVALSSTEYFLIENRHRDPLLADSASAKVTITTRDPETGALSQKTFTNADEDFVFQGADFDTMLDRGTIVDVSNFDWSLPGGLDYGEDQDEGTADDRHLNGGILIWHIDEGIIQNGLLNGGVNADELMRGVDLEEGDAAQDIGRDIGLLDNSQSFGYAYDFWWSGNDYRVITEGNEIDLNPNNVFGFDTYPNTESNSGAKSYFELYNFSDIQPVASFNIRPVTEVASGITPLASHSIERFNQFYTSESEYWDYFALSLALFTSDTDTLLILPSLAYNYITDANNPQEPDFIVGFDNQQPLLGDFIYTAKNPDHTNTPVLTAYRGTIPPIEQWNTTTSQTNGFISSQDGETIDIDFTGEVFDAETGASIANTSGYDFRSEVVDNKFAGINGNRITFVGEDIPDNFATYEHRLFVGTIASNQGNYYYIFEDGKFTLVSPDKEEPYLVLFDEEQAEWPAIVDEGHIYRVNKVQNQIDGINFNGGVLDHMPIPAPDGYTFIGTPIMADITGDEIQDILVVAQNEYSINIFGYELNGNPIEGFPLYVGGSSGADLQPIHPVLYNDVLYAISHKGDLRSWKFNNFTRAQWPGRYGANPYNKVSAYINFTENTGNNFSVLNTTETYNWPNPADDETNIRFELKDAGEVEITVIDFSGRKVFERRVAAIGGVPEEVLISTIHWSSGPYFARVKATVNGQTESKIIKIGVAH